MYISRLKLNSAARKTREVLMNPYMLHQSIYRAFPDKNNGGPGRILYRVDQSKTADATCLLVQSEKIPSWENSNFLVDSLLEEPEYKSFSPDIKAGQCFHFRLKANPAIKKQSENRKNGYRVGILQEEDQIKWLQRKAAQGGFALLTCRIIPGGIIRDEKKGETGKRLAHYSVLYEGILKVEDTATFSGSIRKGIGPAKAFGFGLLSIAPMVK